MEIKYLWPLLEDNEIFLNFNKWEKWGDKYAHVKIKTNRVHKFDKWIKIAKELK